MVVCPYCKKEAKLVKGLEIYPKHFQLKNKYFWVCEECDARVGCHNETTVPLGTLADAELRAERIKTHRVLDTFWISKKWSRRKGYNWLSRVLKMKPKNCHIGKFKMRLCKEVQEIVQTSRTVEM